MTIKTFLYDKFGLGSNPHRLVRCRMSTEDGRVIVRNLPAENGYVLWADTSSAFLLEHSGEVRLRGTNQTELILDEKDAFPWVAEKLSNGKREAWAKTIDQIAANEFSRQKNLAVAKIDKNKSQFIILAMFALISIVLILMIIALFVTNVWLV